MTPSSASLAGRRRASPFSDSERGRNDGINILVLRGTPVRRHAGE
jgi:hypothetical protein